MNELDCVRLARNPEELVAGAEGEIPDGDDHSIDAVRYAMMEDVLRGR